MRGIRPSCRSLLAGDSEPGPRTTARSSCRSLLAGDSGSAPHATARSRARTLLQVGLAAALAFASFLVLPARSAEPLTIDGAVEQALAHNFTIKVESFRVPVAQANLSETFGPFDPRVAFNFSDGTTNQPQGFDQQTGLPLPPAELDSTHYDLGVTGELPLGLTYRIGGSADRAQGTFNDPNNPDYDYFTTFAGASARLPLLRGLGGATTVNEIRVARANLHISEWDFRATVINTVTNVIYAYDQLLFAQAYLRSAHRSRELANGLFEENVRRRDVGSGSEYDVLSARARTATREEGIFIAERIVSEAENSLKQLISDDTTSNLLTRTLELAPMPEPTEVKVDLQAGLAMALEQRPDYQQAKLALQRSDYNVKLMRNLLLPAVDLVGSYGYSGIGPDFPSSRKPITNGDFPAYSAGVSISLPITSRAERARYHTARYLRDQAEMLLQQLEQEIVVAVGNAAGRIDTTWKRVQASRASRDLSQQTLDAEEKRLRAGKGSTFQVLQYQEILTRDEVNEAQALSDYRNALAEYDRQLGRTLETYRINLAAQP